MQSRQTPNVNIRPPHVHTYLQTHPIHAKTFIHAHIPHTYEHKEREVVMMEERPRDQRNSIESP